MDITNYNKLSKKKLKLEFEKINISLPKKGTGTGVNGGILNRDLVKILTKYQKNKIGSKFTLKMEPDLIKDMLKNMDIKDVINFCKINKSIHKICNNSFWHEISKLKLRINILGKYKSWECLANDLYYGIENLYTIGRLYLNGIWSQKQSEYALKDIYEHELFFYFKN